LVPEDGALIHIRPDGAEIVDHVQFGRIAVDGTRLVPLDGNQLRTRRRIMHQGVVLVTLALDFRGKLVAEPQIAAPGLLDEEDDEDEMNELIGLVEESVRSLPARMREDDEDVEEAVRVAVRRWTRRLMDKKPVVRLHIVRV